MTASDVLRMREQGLMEDAYEAARELYAADKSQDASVTMFWTAYDVLKARVSDGRLDEARKIVIAMERLIGRMGSNPEHLQTGAWGETTAMDYLRKNNYEILEHDWHSGHRDIDIIARQGVCVVFVEVKTRRNRMFTEPEEAVDYKKQRNLRQAINHYIKFRNIDGPWRFDVITIIGTKDSSEVEINHIKDFTLSMQ
jgi:uncharacterized protein (TIGR00252 family)